MNAMQSVYLIDLVAKALLFGWFSYALYVHFARQDGEPTGMKWTRLLWLAGIGIDGSLYVATVGSDGISPSAAGFGLCTAMLAALVFHRALIASREHALNVAFSQSTGRALLASGIFGYVRHPFYLAYILYWLSWAITLGFQMPASAILIAVTATYLVSIRLEERALERTFGEDYREYRRRTPALVPFLS